MNTKRPIWKTVRSARSSRSGSFLLSGESTRYTRQQENSEKKGEKRKIRIKKKEEEEVEDEKEYPAYWIVQRELYGHRT